MCLLYGIRITDFEGVIPLWGLLERFEISMSASPLYRQSIDCLTSKYRPSLRTPSARMRAWIRQSLNNKNLDVLLESLYIHINSTSLTGGSIIKKSVNSRSNQNSIILVRKYYHAHSILCDSDDWNVFLAIVRNLKILDFQFNLDDNDLLVIPKWIAGLVFICLLIYLFIDLFVY